MHSAPRRRNGLSKATLATPIVHLGVVFNKQGYRAMIQLHAWQFYWTVVHNIPGDVTYTSRNLPAWFYRAFRSTWPMVDVDKKTYNAWVLGNCDGNGVPQQPNAKQTVDKVRSGRPSVYTPAQKEQMVKLLDRPHLLLPKQELDAFKALSGGLMPSAATIMMPAVRDHYNLPKMDRSSISKIMKTTGLKWVPPSRKQDTLRPGHIINRLAFAMHYKGWEAENGRDWCCTIYSDEKKITR